MTVVIELEDVSLTYPGPSEVNAIRNATFSIDQGEAVAIVGPSGSGKSSLMSVIGLLSRHDSGRYRLEGYDVGHVTEAERCDLRGAFIGYVFQAFHLMARRTALANVEMPLMYHGARFRRQRTDLAREALERVGLSHRLSHRCDTLSGGERQRVAIARALVHRPSIVLADEPTGNLDSQNGGLIARLLLDLADQGVTVVTVTHDLELAASFPRRLRMSDGSVRDE